MERDGQREDREGEGEAHGARGAGGGEREAGGERASELETRQRFMGREGSMAAPRWPAGRWGHVTRPGPRRPPSLADALARPGGGPEVMITRAGTRRSPCPHSRAAQPGERGAMPGREGPFFPTRDRPVPALRSQPWRAPDRAARLSSPRPLPAGSRPSTAAAGPPFPTPSTPRTGQDLALRARPSPALSPGPPAPARK